MKYITTHEELLKLDGKRVECKIDSHYIEDAKIRVEYYSESVMSFHDSTAYPRIYVCQDICCGEDATDKFEYNYSWVISYVGCEYERNSQDCKNIILKKQNPQLEFDF